MSEYWDNEAYIRQLEVMKKREVSKMNKKSKLSNNGLLARARKAREKSYSINVSVKVKKKGNTTKKPIKGTIKIDKTAKKGYTVIIPKAMLNKAPPKIRKEILKMAKSFSNGSLNPKKGKGIAKITPMTEGLMCKMCKSINIDWMTDKKKEVYFKCNNCQESGWMTLKEYEMAKKNFPELFFSKLIREKNNVKEPVIGYMDIG
jgi:ribosomal protein L18E